MKKAFTLVELLVVIGILGILGAVLMGSFSGGTESARNAKCLSNMKTLASAVQSVGMSSGAYPCAGSVEIVGINSGEVMKGGGSKAAMRYWEYSGWLSWNSNNAYAAGPRSHIASAGWFVSAYTAEESVRDYCYTNGALWKAVSGNREVFVCPAHRRDYDNHRKKYSGAAPAWSYVMNSYFGWAGKDAQAKGTGYGGIKYGSLSRADRRLLFAELPFMGVETEPDTSPGAGTKCDCVLQYGLGEVIGFNHSSGKKNKFAHIVFADGHTEKLAWPKNGMSEDEANRLTKWLCEGKDVSFNGTRYEELN